MKLLLQIILLMLSVSVSIAESEAVDKNLNVYSGNPTPASHGKMSAAPVTINKSIDKELSEMKTLLLDTQKVVAAEKAGAYGTALNELKYWIMPSAYILLFSVVAILLMFGWLKEKEIVNLKKKTEDDLKDFKEQIKLSVRVELENNLVGLKDKIHTIIDNSMNTHIKNIQSLKEEITASIDDVVERRLSDFEIKMSQQFGALNKPTDLPVPDDVIETPQASVVEEPTDDPFNGDLYE